jgi:hypothetical protein
MLEFVFLMLALVGTSMQRRVVCGEPKAKIMRWAFENPVYCGKIYVPKNKDEEDYFVQGQHEPLILISFVNNKLAENKNGKELDFSSLSHQVIPLGFEPRTTTLKV